MASPQLEKGHTRIANELLNEIIKLNLNGTQFRIVTAIWRYTYGFQTTEKEISIRFLAEKMEANRRQVDRELKALIKQNIVSVTNIGEKGARILKVNKNYEEWGKEKTGKQPSSPKTKTKSNIKPKYTEESTYYKMAVYFHKQIAVVAKEAGVEHLVKKANLQNYADEFRKMVEIDGVTKKQAKEVMDWVTQDPFWKTNILSAKKLRDKFLDLAIRMNAERKPSQPKQQQDHRDMEIALQQWIAEGKDPDEFKWTD